MEEHYIKISLLGGWMGFIIGIILWLHGLAEVAENKSKLFLVVKLFKVST